MKNLIITGRNLTKSYDGIHNILSDVNIEIEAGSKNLIIGAFYNHQRRADLTAGNADW